MRVDIIVLRLSELNFIITIISGAQILVADALTKRCRGRHISR